MTRREARENAFIFIFEKSFTGYDINEIIDYAKETREFSDDPDGYAVTVFTGVFEKLSEIDAVISDHLSGWTINRISKVSLAVLRLAIYEIMYREEIPPAVSVDEAVELCKKYSVQDDAPFVNGVLGSVIRGRE